MRRPRKPPAAISALTIAATVLVALVACAAPLNDHRAPIGPSSTLSIGSHAPPAPDASRTPDADGLAELPPTPVPADAVDAAVTFAGAWARPGLSADRWREEITVLATAEYATLLRTVDPANVPATRIVGQAVPRESTTLRVTVDVPTDAGLLTVVCVTPHGRWVVASVQMQERR